MFDFVCCFNSCLETVRNICCEKEDSGTICKSTLAIAKISQNCIMSALRIRFAKEDLFFFKSKKVNSMRTGIRWLLIVVAVFCIAVIAYLATRPKPVAVDIMIAKREDVPSYVVFGNKTLEALARYQPVNAEEALHVPGIGAAKVQRYAKPFLEAIVVWKKSRRA